MSRSMRYKGPAKFPNRPLLPTLVLVDGCNFALAETEQGENELNESVANGMGMRYDPMEIAKNAVRRMASQYQATEWILYFDNSKTSSLSCWVTEESPNFSVVSVPKINGHDADDEIVEKVENEFEERMLIVVITADNGLCSRLPGRDGIVHNVVTRRPEWLRYHIGALPAYIRNDHAVRRRCELPGDTEILCAIKAIAV